MADAALDGLKVVELGDFISAAYAGKLLADLGADVVKVEPPVRGDSARRHGPFVDDEPHPERSGLYLFLNANKRGVTLDPSNERGRELFEGLAGWADIVIHNAPPQDLEQWGIGFDTLAERYPQLIMVSISVFGYDTPYRDWKGYALNATAGSGIAHRIGDPDRAPLWLPYCAADFQGGVHGAMAALLALRARRSTGEGQHAWLSIIEVMSVYLGSGLPGFVFSGQLRGRAGKNMNSFYPWQVAPVADGYFEIITMVDDQWRRFVELMGSPPWAEDERLQNRWLSFQWSDELDAYWHPWLAQRTREELARTFAEQRIPFQPVQTIDEVAASEHLRARGFWQQIEHPEAGAYTTLGAPYRLSETPWAIRRPPPLLGQHNRELYVETLGVDDDELDALVRAGVV